jgi:predicted nucleotidyltransferase
MAVDIETVKRIAIDYANEVRSTFPIDKVILFGSYANGTATKLSDVDIAFIFRNYGDKTRFDIGLQLLKLCRGYEAYFEPLAFETMDIEQGNPFVKEILRTGQEI